MANRTCPFCFSGNNNTVFPSSTEAFVSDTLVTLAEVIDESLSPLDKLTALLAASGHEDIAVISASLLRDTRTRLQSAARCLEAGCGRPIMLLNMGGVLCPAPCVCVKKQPRRAKDNAASSL